MNHWWLSLLVYVYVLRLEYMWVEITIMGLVIVLWTHYPTVIKGFQPFSGVVYLHMEIFQLISTYRGRDQLGDISQTTFLNAISHWKLWISLMISLTFVPTVLIMNIGLCNALATPGDKPSSEPMMVILLAHICGTRPRWVTISVDAKFSISVIKITGIH